MEKQSIATIVGNCASLAALLEVSAYPKPGNVHRLNEFPETSYERFLAGGVALGSVMGEIAVRSYTCQDYADVRVGKGIFNAVDTMFQWQRGGNIHLGVILLLAPLSAGAGASPLNGCYKIEDLRDYTKRVTTSATRKDTIEIYRAIDKAMSSENLGSTDELDVTNKDSIERIKKDNITPLKIFDLCKERDLICREWVTGFETVFDVGYPSLQKRIKEGSRINDATVDTFIKLLSENPDSLIIRKKGADSANFVLEEARRIMEVGGTKSEEGIKMLWSFDKKLKKENGKLNPGTTADLTAASLFVLLLSGWRP